jgi:hypothetical protein
VRSCEILLKTRIILQTWLIMKRTNIQILYETRLCVALLFRVKCGLIKFLESHVLVLRSIMYHIWRDFFLCVLVDSLIANANINSFDSIAGQDFRRALTDFGYKYLFWPLNHGYNVFKYPKYDTAGHGSRAV